MTYDIPKFMKSHQTLLSQEEESDLINDFLNNGSEKSLKKIILAFSPIVIKYTRKYSSYGINSDELISTGNHALVEAAHRFDPKLGNRFATYCTSWIKGMMLGYIASNYLSVSIKNQKTKKMFFSLRSILYKEFHQTGNEGISPEILKQLQTHFEVSADDIESIYHVIKQPHISLNEISTNEDGEGISRENLLESENPNPEELLITQSIDRYRYNMIHEAIEHALNAKERRIILKLMPDDDNFTTLQELADELTISRERVRQIKEKAKEKIKKYITAHVYGVRRQDLFI